MTATHYDTNGSDRKNVMKSMLNNSLVPAPSGSRPGAMRRQHTWQSIKAEVLARIHDGTWPAGALIPTEQELSQEMGCARATVNRALRDLADSGLLERRRKVGTRVALSRTQDRAGGLRSMRMEIEAAGLTPEYQHVNTRELPAPANITAALHLPADTVMLRVHGHILTDGQPYLCLTYWISRQAVNGYSLPDFVTIAPDDWLRHSIPPTRSNAELMAVAMPANCAGFFTTTPGTPALMLQTEAWDGARPISLGQMVFAPEHRLQSTT
ncbi:MAG: GntR family transcriptional regulator [Paracoccus sp. (in: a-proteobacteria)]|uniref:GntR family transcriptional regulator n=1 Tax=Paracoccus sp. TaxID=267 RepID=UPI0026DFEA14|nr:GntR family transcriptional regulator [Paracoccus sp. (in: a-proteobacteria)]MDO5621224.1 GntR family transcriptional regulator [Paracoccus sp. (in: a-proteobacteria)]